MAAAAAARIEPRRGSTRPRGGCSGAGRGARGAGRAPVGGGGAVRVRGDVEEVYGPAAGPADLLLGRRRAAQRRALREERGDARRLPPCRGPARREWLQRLLAWGAAGWRAQARLGSGCRACEAEVAAPVAYHERPAPRGFAARARRGGRGEGARARAALRQDRETGGVGDAARERVSPALLPCARAAAVRRGRAAARPARGPEAAFLALRRAAGRGGACGAGGEGVERERGEGGGRDEEEARRGAREQRRDLARDPERGRGGCQRALEAARPAGERARAARLLSTGGRTRCVRLVRGEGRDVSA